MEKWHLILIIVGCIVSLIISGAIQYHYAQKQVKELSQQVDLHRQVLADVCFGMANIFETLAEQKTQNARLMSEVYELYEAVTPTHDLMMAEAITK